MNKAIAVLAIGVLIFTAGAFPLIQADLSTPSRPYQTMTDDGVLISFEITKREAASGGSPVALLLHGFSGNRGMMKMIALALADRGFVCASVDLRGHGSSEGFMRGYEGFYRDLDAVLLFIEQNGLGDTSGIAIVGHSMGGGVSMGYASNHSSVATVIGVAPATSPDFVNTSTPRNLLMIIATGDSIINSSMVMQAFYKSINGKGESNTVYDIGGNLRELFVIQGPDHLNILYSPEAIGKIVSWSTAYVLGEPETLGINPYLIHVGVYVSLAGGCVAIASLVYFILDRPRRNASGDGRKHIEWAALLRWGALAAVLTGILGAPLSLAFSLALIPTTPLLFTNFTAAIFFGNSAVFALMARGCLNRESKSYLGWLGESIKKSKRIGIPLGVAASMAFMLLVYFTMGLHTTSTLSTSSLRLLLVPAYSCIYALAFLFYESFFKGGFRALMPGGAAGMACSIASQIAVTISSILLELVVVTSILRLFLPFLSLSFLILGLNLVLVPLIITVSISEVFHGRTGGLAAQIIVGSILFATMVTVFSPVLAFSMGSFP